jgi:hypothetical protein
MNLDRDNFYMKIVAFVQIYNFVVPTFFSFDVILKSKKWYTTHILVLGF